MKTWYTIVPGIVTCGLLVVASCVALPAWASEQTVTLTDGSRIRGEVVSMRDGKYSIATRSLGVVEVDSSRVVSISGADAAPALGQSSAAASALSATAAIQEIQSTIANDPALLSRILNLQSDPDMQAALNDPEVMRAVQSFDIDALLKNPKFQALLNNPKIKDIQSGVH